MLDESHGLCISMQPIFLEKGGNPSSNLGRGVYRSCDNRVMFFMCAKENTYPSQKIYIYQLIYIIS